MPASAKRILIAPLDWGLGHTTRCIPIIHQLQGMGHTVVFAGNETQQSFIRQSFPQIDSRLLEGYRVMYSKRALMLTLLLQLPRLLNTIRREHLWLKSFVAYEKIDGIISDNRYGLWHAQKPSIILTHQPGILTGLISWTDTVVRKIHYQFLARFSEVWIPDQPDETSLAGKLSHPPELPERRCYIGWLSQFSKGDRNASNKHVLILLSGPEPQRSILADKLWQQAKNLQQPIVFVEGKQGALRNDIPPHIRHIALADAQTLQPLLVAASLVICRSGYSTLMDLAMFGKPAILIPTPGQTEQEYLAKALAQAGIFYTAAQEEFALSEEMLMAESGSRLGMSLDMGRADLLAPALAQWLEKL
jgi:uncharacterized protein (TIGR00661 family)